MDGWDFLCDGVLSRRVRYLGEKGGLWGKEEERKYGEKFMDEKWKGKQ
jgi:hypothetical protein